MKNYTTTTTTHETCGNIKESAADGDSEEGIDGADCVVLGKQLEGASAEGFGELSSVVWRAVGRVVLVVYGR